MVTLGGEAGAAEKEITDRLGTYPFTSLAWLRADLTGEQVTEFDDTPGSEHRRRFKEFSGDISGRYIEIMAMDAQKSTEKATMLNELLAEAIKNQREGGYFCSSGEVDWTNAMDKELGPKVFYPALWGNGRMLCGLVEAYRASEDAEVLKAVNKLGDFYVNTLPIFTDPSRITEYVNPGSYYSNYVICYFPAMEGLVKLYSITGEKKYLETAETMASFLEQFDRLPIDHSHGMLCNHISLLHLYEATGNQYYLNRVKNRWQELVDGGYIQSPGGPLEKCRVFDERDEGCAHTDWFRLNLELSKTTGDSKYLAMAERIFHNHFMQNQTLEGGHGHRHMIGDENGMTGFDTSMEESTWCCIYHGRLAFLLMKNNLITSDKEGITCNFSLDFNSTSDEQEIVSDILPAKYESEIYRQHIQIKRGDARNIHVRVPHWATSLSAVDAEGKSLEIKIEDGFGTLSESVSEATFIYNGDAYAEDRNFEQLANEPEPGNTYTLWYGPRLLVTEGSVPPVPTWPLSMNELKEVGYIPLSAETRAKEIHFVVAENDESNDLRLSMEESIMAGKHENNNIERYSR